MHLRTVVWPVTALWDAAVLGVCLSIAVPVALWLSFGELRTWKRRTF